MADKYLKVLNMSGLRKSRSHSDYYELYTSAMSFFEGVVSFFTSDGEEGKWPPQQDLSFDVGGDEKADKHGEGQKGGRDQCPDRGPDPDGLSEACFFDSDKCAWVCPGNKTDDDTQDDTAEEPGDEQCPTVPPGCRPIGNECAVACPGDQDDDDKSDNKGSNDFVFCPEDEVVPLGCSKDKDCNVVCSDNDDKANDKNQKGNSDNLANPVTYDKNDNTNTNEKDKKDDSQNDTDNTPNQTQTSTGDEIDYGAMDLDGCGGSFEGCKTTDTCTEEDVELAKVINQIGDCDTEESQETPSLAGFTLPEFDPQTDWMRGICQSVSGIIRVRAPNPHPVEVLRQKETIEMLNRGMKNPCVQAYIAKLALQEKRMQLIMRLTTRVAIPITIAFIGGKCAAQIIDNNGEEEANEIRQKFYCDNLSQVEASYNQAKESYEAAKNEFPQNLGTYTEPQFDDQGRMIGMQINLTNTDSLDPSDEEEINRIQALMTSLQAAAMLFGEKYNMLKAYRDGCNGKFPDSCYAN
jgi:hypothetical protein